MTGRNGRGIKRGGRTTPSLVTSIIILVISGMIFFPGFSFGNGTAEVEKTKAWNHDDFDDNILLIYSPKNPNSTQSVDVLIESKDGILIKGANIHINVTRNEAGPAQGGWSFVPVNDTAMETVIPAYENGDIISFYVQVWDFDNDVIVSPTYSYIMSGEIVEGWHHDSFEENVVITYVPEEPGSNEKVSVQIRSRDPEVTIAGANLHIKVTFREQNEQAGGLVFTRVNSTTMVSEIPGYPLGTSVTFWAEAWDKDIVVLTSNESTYTIATFGYETYGNEEFPTMELYGAYAVSLLLSVLIFIYYSRRIKKGERITMKAIAERMSEGPDD
jgi:hypothetical protein